MSSEAPAVDVIIRPMDEGDLDQVHAIDLISFSLPWPKHSFRYELLQNARSMLWVAQLKQEQVEKKIIGDIVVWLILDEAHIATLAVLPEYRRQGLARGLVLTALIHAEKNSARFATLEVRESNTPAQSLYLGFGFEIISKRRRYYRDNNEDALIMTLSDLDQKIPGLRERFGSHLTGIQDKPIHKRMFPYI